MGTQISSNISKIFELNFPPLLKAVRALLDKWITSLHSWFGRCNILKMSILPKFLYLLQALPSISQPLTSNRFRKCFLHGLTNTLDWNVISCYQNNTGVWRFQTSANTIRLFILADSWIGTDTAAVNYGFGLNKPKVSYPLVGRLGVSPPCQQRWNWTPAKLCSTLFTQTMFSSWNSPQFPILGNLLFTPRFQDSTFQALLVGGLLAINFDAYQSRWELWFEIMESAPTHAFSSYPITTEKLWEAILRNSARVQEQCHTRCRLIMIFWPCPLNPTLWVVLAIRN